MTDTHVQHRLEMIYIGNYTPKYHHDQIFYLLNNGVHPIRDYGHPGKLHPINIGRTPRQYLDPGRGCD